MEDVISYCRFKHAAVAYFYFDRCNELKKEYQGLLRSLVAQLSLQYQGAPNPLHVEFSKSQDGQRLLEEDTILAVLQSLLQGFSQTFIVIDALDECDQESELLGLLRNVVDQKIGNVCVLATSRRKWDIEKSTPSNTDYIWIDEASVAADIHAYLRARLRDIPKSKNCVLMMKEYIETTLISGSHGV